MKRSMVSLRFTYAKLATVIRLYSPVQYIFEERARNWLEDPRLPLPFPPLPCLSCAHPVPLFLVEYPTKWGQVLRRICGIDGTHLSGRMVYPRADRGSYE